MSSVDKDEKEIPWPILPSNLKFTIYCLYQLFKKQGNILNIEQIILYKSNIGFMTCITGLHRVFR